MGRVALWLIVVQALLALSSSCSQPQTKAVLPADWPVPGLTLPDGSYQDVLPIFMRHPESENIHTVKSPSRDGTVWMIAFDGDYSFAELVEHVEGQIFNLGYSKVEDDIDSSNEMTIVYETRDQKGWLRVGFHKHYKDSQSDAFECYYYEAIARD